MRELVKKGTFGFGVFECNDLLATYEELKAKGVTFKKLPRKSFTDLKPYLLMTPEIGFHLEKKRNEPLQEYNLSRILPLRLSHSHFNNMIFVHEICIGHL